MSVVKVYRYGLLPPEENRDLVLKTLRLAHEYRNKLVEIDRQERAEIRAVQTSHGSIPALDAAAKAAIQAKETAYQAIKAHKAQDRTRKVPEALKATYETAKASAFAASQALWQARAALRGDPTVAIRRDEISLRYNEKRKAARAASGIYHGTYMRVEAADQQARKTTPLWDGVEPSDVRFARWRGRRRGPPDEGEAGSGGSADEPVVQDRAARSAEGCRSVEQAQREAAALHAGPARRLGGARAGVGAVADGDAPSAARGRRDPLGDGHAPACRAPSGVGRALHRAP